MRRSKELFDGYALCRVPFGSSIRKWYLEDPHTLLDEQTWKTVRGTDMTENKDPILITCNIVEKEIRRLIESGWLKASVTFLSSKLHYD